MSFEEALSARITVGVSDPPETDLDYYARPENYAGANMLMMTKIARAQNKQTNNEIDTDKAANSAAMGKLLDRYKDVGASRSTSCASSVSDLRVVTDTTRPKSSLTIPFKDNSRPYSAGSERAESYGHHRHSHPDTRKRRKSLTEMMAANSSHDLSDSRASTPRHTDRVRKLSRKYSDAKLTGSDSDSASDISRKISSVSRGSGPYRSIPTLPNSISSQELRALMAKERFQHAIKIILILLRWISSLTEKSDGGENGDKQHGRTFTDIAQEAFASDELKNSGLSFDVSQFKAKKEVNMTNEVKTILSTPSKARTTEQLQAVLYGLQHLKSFAEYPLHMQEKLCKVAWFQNVPPKRVIIRQGHFAENFYFILSGQAVVRILEKNPKTGETNLRTATVMRKGTSFGELALLHRSRRTATVVSQDAVQLLTIGRDDFFDIFMSGQGPGEIPEHIQFVSGLEFMKDWPCEELLDHPEFCLFHFFKRGVVIVKDSNKSDWLYIVKSGSCQVMKQLRSVVPKVGRGRHALCDDQSLPVRLPKLGTGDVEARVDTRIRRQGTADNYHSPLADINNLLREADLKLSKEGEEIKSFLKLPMRRPAGSANSNADETSQEECNRKEERSLMLRQEPVKVDSFSKSRYRRFPKTREPHFAQSSSRPGQRSASAKHHRPPTATPRPKSETDSQSQIYKGPVFVQVEVLKPKDAFGLNTVNFDDERDKDTTTVSLVSNGAECVMLSKKFFMDHGNELVKKMIRHQIRPYPSESALQENLQTKVDWNVYRKKLIKDAVAFRRHVADFTAR